MGLLDLVGKVAGFGVGGPIGMGVGGALGDAMGSGGYPTYQSVPLDPETEALAKRIQERAERPASAIADEQLEGTNNSQALKQDLSQKATDNHLGGDLDAGIQEAINRRSMKDYDAQMNEMERKVRVNAPAERFQRMSGGADVQARVSAINSAIADRELTANLNRRAARNAVMGNILGLGGAGIGAMMGGPQGAQAGLAIGSGMGGNKNMGYMGDSNRGRG